MPFKSVIFFVPITTVATILNNQSEKQYFVKHGMEQWNIN